MNLEVLLQQFLNARLVRKSPVLLGLSGGTDSTALFSLLLRYRIKWDLELHVAHIDHGWRSESVDEAKAIEKWAFSERVPCHIRVLSEGLPERNSEDIARRHRLQAFSQICRETGCQAVMLAHHANDRAETVLKRLFEGAPLSRCSGMTAVSYIEDLVIWRPLLDARKTDILAYLREKNLAFFDDRTNYDPKYLRSRLRLSVMPQLSEIFGKEVASGLCAVGAECEELKLYLDQQTQIFINRIVRQNSGFSVDLEGCTHGYEIKHLLRHLARLAGVTLSRAIVEDVCHHVLGGSLHKQFPTRHYVIKVHRRCVSLNPVGYLFPAI